MSESVDSANEQSLIKNVQNSLHPVIFLNKYNSGHIDNFLKENPIFQNINAFVAFWFD